MNLLTGILQNFPHSKPYVTLGPNSKCIPVIQYFRPNFEIAKSEDGRLFPLKPPVIFPLLRLL